MDELQKFLVENNLKISEVIVVDNYGRQFLLSKYLIYKRNLERAEKISKKEQ